MLFGSVSYLVKKGMVMGDIVFSAASFGKRGMLSLLLVAAAAVLVLVLLAQSVFSHLLEDGHGSLNAFNFDEATLAHLNSDCAYKYECQRSDAKDTFFYNCYYDAQSSECQCSKGAFSSCSVGSSSLDVPKAAALKRQYSGNGFVLAVVGGFFGKFNSLPILAKIVVVAVAVAAVIFVFRRFRDTASRNFRRAESLHAEAAKLHETGNEEEAKLLFEKAGYYREKAYEQLNQKV